MNLLQRSITLVVALAVILVMYLLISQSYMTIQQEFLDINRSASDTQMETVGSITDWVFGFIFGGLACATIVWFAIDTLKEEPDWGRRNL